MDIKLNVEDYENLLLSLESFEKSGFGELMMKTMFRGIMDKEKSLEENETKQDLDKYEEEVKSKKENVAILRAKLILLKDKCLVDATINDISKD